VLVKKLSKDLGVDLSKQKFYKGQGCEQCNHKGYTGRIGIYEALETTEKIRELVTKRATSDELQKQAVSEG
jgi:type IV pilus assembly protein PilB